jgi:hypothetical protein
MSNTIMDRDAFAEHLNSFHAEIPATSFRCVGPLNREVYLNRYAEA